MTLRELYEYGNSANLLDTDIGIVINKYIESKVVQPTITLTPPHIQENGRVVGMGECTYEDLCRLFG